MFVMLVLTYSKDSLLSECDSTAPLLLLQGNASRSLQSAYRIMSEMDSVNVKHMDRGLFGAHHIHGRIIYIMGASYT